MQNKHHLGSPACWEKFPTFFSENLKRGRIITIPTFAIRSPALPLFAGWGVSQTSFATNLWPVDSSLFFFSLKVSYSQELSWMSPRSWERAMVAMAPAFSSHVIQIMERWSNLYTQLICQMHVTHL